MKGKPSGFLGKTHSIETRKRISENNGRTLSEEIINFRIMEYKNIEKRNGYIQRLAEQWNVSHTQVQRFIKKFCFIS